jgi:pyrrolidone-carboxylate peptidase
MINLNCLIYKFNMLSHSQSTYNKLKATFINIPQKIKEIIEKSADIRSTLNLNKMIFC